MLDIDVSDLGVKKGLLIPRMTSAERQAIALSQAAQGLLVYQTDGVQGFYYNTSTTTTPTWVYLFASSLNHWSLTGNAGSTAGSNFLGTTDAADLVVKTSNTERLRVLSGGNVGIGTPSPNEQLEITRNFRLPNSTATTGIIYSGASRYIHNYGSTTNFFAGVNAGNLTTLTGSENTGIGYGTLANNTNGVGNAGIGVYVLNANTTGYDNNAMGRYALGSNTTGIRNVGIGYIALTSNTTGNANVAVGPYALADHRKNDGNVAIGSAALRFDTTGVENTTIGNNAMYFNKNGSHNVAIGQSAGLNATGSYNVFLGYSAGHNETGSHKLYIDNSSTASPLLYGDFDTDLLRVNGTLNVNSAYSLPTTDGTSGQVLTTNGAGTLSWASNGADNLGSHTATQNIRLNSHYLSNDGGNEGIRIDDTGNVGIGTTTPANKLHVAGNIRMVDGNQAAGKVLTSDANGTATWTTPNSGTVTFVGLAMPSIFHVTNSPVTGSGTLTSTLASQSANTVLAAPNGAAGTPSFRSLTAADMPSGTVTADNGLTVNTGNNVRLGGTLATATTITQGTNALTILNNGTANTTINLSATGDFNVQDNGTSAFLVKDDGKVGIGTTSPNEQLEITRNFRLPNSTATTGIIYSGASRYIHNYGSTTNFFAGIDAGNLTTLTGFENTGIGYGTLAKITTGIGNAGIGAYALSSTTTGEDNNAMGSYALASNTTGIRNVGIGYIALTSNTTGNANVAVGPYALADHRKNDGNVAIGSAALRFDTTGVENTSIGNDAMYNNNNGSRNVALGQSAGYNSVGSYNVFLGYSAGHNETGSHKLYIDNSNTSSPLLYGDFSTDLLRVNGTLNVNSAYSLPTTDGTSGQVLTTNGAGTLSWASNGADNLGSHTATQNIRLNSHYLSNDGGNEGIRIDDTGNVGIGTASPTKARVEINGARNATMAYGFLNSAGAVGTNGSATNAYSLYASGRIAATEFNAFSDARIKNIRGASNGAQDLQTLMNLRITDYTFKDTVAKGVGFNKKVIAQQVAQVYPQAVSTITDVVPDIYKLAELKAGRIELANTLKAGEKVKLIFADQETVTEVVAANAEGFRVNLPGSGKVFVYGREVKDFHTVDYEALGTLNISATQELMKMITKQHEIIQSLKAENEVVKTENKAVKTRLGTVEAEVQQIKEMIGIQAKLK